MDNDWETQSEREYRENVRKEEEERLKAKQRYKKVKCAKRIKTILTVILVVVYFYLLGILDPRYGHDNSFERFLKIIANIILLAGLIIVMDQIWNKDKRHDLDAMKLDEYNKQQKEESEG